MRGGQDGQHRHPLGASGQRLDRQKGRAADQRQQDGKRCRARSRGQGKADGDERRRHRNDRQRHVQRRGGSRRRLHRGDRAEEPAEEIRGLGQRPGKDDGDQDVPVGGCEPQKQLPLGPEAGKGRQGRDRDDEQRKKARQGRATGQANRGAGVRGPDGAGQAEQPRLGEKVVDEKPEGHEGYRLLRADPGENGQRQRQQRHLSDRGIAQHPLHVALPQPDEVRGQEGQRRRGHDQVELPGEQRQQLPQREDHPGRGADRQQGRKGGRHGLVDIERPAIGRIGFQFDQKAGQDHRQRDPGHRPDDQCPVRDQQVDVEMAGHLVEQHRAQQEQGGGDDRRHHVFERGLDACPRCDQPQKPIGADRHDLEEDEEVEEVAGEDHAVDPHHQDQEQQQRHVVVTQPVPERRGQRQRHQVDRNGESALRQAEAQVDRHRRLGPGGQNLDGRSGLEDGNKRRDAGRGQPAQGDEEPGMKPAIAQAVEQRDHEAAADPEQEDADGLGQKGHSRPSRKAPMSRVPWLR